METSLLFALATFAFVSTVTPGPNNLMLLASGAQYGYKNRFHICLVLLWALQA